MKKIPFSVYDFFGYLAPGFLILLVLGFVPDINGRLNKLLYHSPQGIASDSVLAAHHDSLLQQADWYSHRLEIALDRNAELQDTLQKQALAQDGLDNASLVLRALDNHVKVQEALHSNLQFREGLYEKARIQKQGANHFLLQKDLSFGFVILWVGVAYLIGHILAGPSAWILERIITKRCLKAPSINLLWGRTNKKRWGWTKLWTGIFSHYVEQFPKKIQDGLKEQLKNDRIREDDWEPWKNPKTNEQRQGDNQGQQVPDKEIRDRGQAIYLHAYRKVQSDESARDVLDIFLKLYGFARNISFSFLLAGLILPAVKNFWAGDFSWWLIVCCLAASIAMFFCYLKFYRLYYRELFLAYAELSSKKPSVVSALRKQAW